ncbi:MAG: hypothetical protein ABI644_13160 [Arenimonas sp.]
MNAKIELQHSHLNLRGIKKFGKPVKAGSFPPINPHTPAPAGILFLNFGAGYAQE